MATDIHEASFFKVSFDDGIFFFEFTREVNGTAAQAWEWMNLIADIRSGVGRPYAQLTRVNERVTLTSEGRMVMRQTGDRDYVVAHSLVTHNRAFQMMVRFLMVLSPRDRFEERIFGDEEKAVKWLRKKGEEEEVAPVSLEEALALVLRSDKEPRPF